MYLSQLICTAVSLRKCFYLSAVVLVLSTLMAAVIIVKLSPLEAVKCQPQTVTAALEWSTVTAPGLPQGQQQQQHQQSLLEAAGASIATSSLPSQPATAPSPAQDNEMRYREMREKMVQNKVARMSRRMRMRLLPLLQQQQQQQQQQNQSAPGYSEPNYEVHIFYYAWYRSLEYDGAYGHWDHRILPNWKKNDKRVFPEGQHSPPADIGANYYPSLGPYSSRDPRVIDLHMRQLRDASIGVVVVSWTPSSVDDSRSSGSSSSSSSDWMMPDLLDAAQRHQLRIAPHMEPYPGRNPINLLEHIRYVLERYGSHPALYRMRREEDGPLLPVIYIYDSYVFPSSAWWELLSPRGNLTLRGSELDAVYIGLLVDAQHKNHIKKSHFDGFYTYFGINGFSYGSSWKNWKDLGKFASQNGLLFVPSIGPGYIDTQIRPWNAENTRHRRHGQYYEVAWRSALNSGASLISITSFNEWHEGTQIEPAKPASNKDFTYLDYEPEGSDFYLNLTKWWVQHFTDKLHRSSIQANSALS